MIYISCVENAGQNRLTFEQSSQLLRSNGIENELSYYSSLGEALERIPLERPDILFLDLSARGGPTLSALDVARSLRHHPLCRNMVIVGIPDQGTASERAMATAAGCRDFVPIPVRSKGVEEVIRRQFRRQTA